MEEGEQEKLGVLNWLNLDEEIKSREEGEFGSESREKGDLLPCSSPLHRRDNYGKWLQRKNVKMMKCNCHDLKICFI